MAEFAYNNAKNASTAHMPFELNCGYYLCIFFKENTDLHFRSRTADKLLAKLQKPMTVCQKNLLHAQELYKQAQYKDVKPRNYAPDNKVWLNSKYIKTKQNQKLKAKFFRLFQILHPISKQVYKLELPKK